MALLNPNPNLILSIVANLLLIYIVFIKIKKFLRIKRVGRFLISILEQCSENDMYHIINNLPLEISSVDWFYYKYFKGLEYNLFNNSRPLKLTEYAPVADIEKFLKLPPKYIILDEKYIGLYY